MQALVDLKRAAVGAPWGRWVDRIGRYPIAPALYVAWKYRLGMDSVVRAHDNLEHFVPVFDRMSLGDVFSAPGHTLDFVLGGLPRNMVGSELNVGLLLGVLLPLMWSMIASDLFARLVAYYGMRRLLRAVHLDSDRLAYIGAPILFSLIPMIPSMIGSVAGVPLLLSALVGLHGKPVRRDYLVIAVFPMLSWAGATVAYVTAIAAYGLVAGALRLVPRAVARGTAVLVAATAVVEWRLLWTTLAGPESHRAEMGSVPSSFDLGALSGSVYRLGRATLEAFEKHATDAATIVVPASAILVVAALATVLMRRRIASSADSVLATALVGLAAVGIWSRLVPAVNDHVVARLGTVPPIQFDRLAWAAPALAYLAIAASIVAVERRFRAPIVTMAVVVTLVLQGVGAWRAADFSGTERARVGVSTFYAPGVFDRVRSLIAADGAVDRVVSVGFHPHVAVYNGFDAADGYWYSYPLEYKHRFRQLIAPALDVDPSLAFYFDDWGSRAYVFQPALGVPPCCEPVTYPPYELLVDPTAFADLGISHVLSNGEVTNASDLGLRLLGTATAAGSVYEITVYATDR